jgi:hypothetical protein
MVARAMPFSDGGVPLLIKGIVASTLLVTVGRAALNGREGCFLTVWRALVTLWMAARYGREGCS